MLSERKQKAVIAYKARNVLFHAVFVNDYVNMFVHAVPQIILPTLVKLSKG